MITIKYKGSGESGAVTNNVEYKVLHVVGNPPKAVIIDDNGDLYVSDTDIVTTATWELVSVNYVDGVELVP